MISVAAAFLAPGCVNEYRSGRIVEVGTPDAGPQFTYKIVGPVTGTASDTVISPCLPYLSVGMEGAVRNASEIAAGYTIYDRDDVDVVLNPKRRIVTSNYFVFGMAEVSIKGVGAALQRPDAKTSSAPAPKQ